MRVKQHNGSPAPVFETDEERSYFLIRLPIHAGFLEEQPVIPEVTHQVTHQVKSLLLICDAAIGVCQASCPIFHAANLIMCSGKVSCSLEGLSQTASTGFQLRIERFFQRSGLVCLTAS